METTIRAASPERLAAYFRQLRLYGLIALDYYYLDHLLIAGDTGRGVSLADGHFELIKSIESLTNDDYEQLTAFLEQRREVVLWTTKQSFIYVEHSSSRQEHSSLIHNHASLGHFLHHSGVKPEFRIGVGNDWKGFHQHEFQVYSLVSPSSTMEGLAKLLLKSARALSVWFVGQEGARSPLVISQETFESLILSPRHSVTFANLWISQQQCRIISESVFVRFLRCTLDDNGRALVDSIENNQGPKTLILNASTRPMLSSESCSEFLEGLRRNTRIEFLAIWGNQITTDDEWQLLIEALGESNGIKEVLLDCARASDAIFEGLMRAISTHPLIWHLELINIVPPQWNQTQRTQVRVRRNLAIAQMLDTNKMITELVLNPSDVDEETWTRAIAPRLKNNFYKARAAEVAAAKPEFKQGLLGRALGKVKDDINGLYVFLSTNTSSLAESLEAGMEQRDQMSIREHRAQAPIRKRKRSDVASNCDDS